jgi:hypothetical protein
MVFTALMEIKISFTTGNRNGSTPIALQLLPFIGEIK